MPMQHNYLRMHRRKSRLLQSDIAFLLQLEDVSNISRWEQGVRKPKIDVLMIYHLLFDIRIDSLYERQEGKYEDILVERLETLLKLLESSKTSQRTGSRIAFIKEALARLKK